jgi:hypothetical protein
MRSLVISQITIENKAWYAIYTRPKEEERAANNLMVWGVETLTTRIKERRLNEFSSNPTYIDKPLFPRYTFALFNAGTLPRKFHYTRGVHYVVSIGNNPLKVNIVIVEIIVGIFERRIKATDRITILLTAITCQGHISIKEYLVEEIS